MITMKDKNNINKFKYMIFDLDGTLIDSMVVWDNLGFDYLSKNNIASKSDLKEVLKTMTIPLAAEYFIKEYKLDKTSEQIVREVVDMIDYKYKYEIPLKPFVKEYLDNQKALGTRMCIATASDVKYVTDALKRLGVYDCFEFVLSCSEYKTDKNKPDIFHIAAEKFGAEVSEIVVFEDALHSIKTAKNAGYSVVAVYDEFMKHDLEDIKKEADYYIDTFEELI